MGRAAWDLGELVVGTRLRILLVEGFWTRQARGEPPGPLNKPLSEYCYGAGGWLPSTPTTLTTTAVTIPVPELQFHGVTDNPRVRDWDFRSQETAEPPYPHEQTGVACEH